MGSGGSSLGLSSLIRGGLSGVSNVSKKVGEIANNPTVQRVGQVASVGATLSGHPEIAAGISAGLVGAKELSPIISDVTGDLSNKMKPKNETRRQETYRQDVPQNETSKIYTGFGNQLRSFENNRRLREASVSGKNILMNDIIRSGIRPVGGDVASIPPQHRESYLRKYGKK